MTAATAPKDTRASAGMPVLHGLRGILTRLTTRGHVQNVGRMATLAYHARLKHFGMQPDT